MTRHRPICAVLEEISNAATSSGDTNIVKLCDEAITYAKRMDAKLVEIRAKEQENGKDE
jgi:hypothetical protein